MPAAKKLRTHVHVHQEDGSVVVYGPEDTVPAADAKRIGDHCWEDDKDSDGDKPAAARRNSGD